jgi:hypothetical protein
MIQEAPEPTELHDLVEKLHYKPGWTFELSNIDRGQGSKGLTLEVVPLVYNSYHVDQGCTYRVRHFMPVPPAAYDRRSWQRWLFEQIAAVERHECMEFFAVGGEKPFAPHHQPGADPYTLFELGTREEQRTSFRGELNPE